MNENRHTPGPSPAALRAAKAIAELTAKTITESLRRQGWDLTSLEVSPDGCAEVAAIIDRETAAPDLLEALKEMACWMPGSWLPGNNAAQRGAKCETLNESLELMRAAISKAEC